MEKALLQFRVLGQPVSIDIEPLPSMARLDEVLPALRVLDDQLTTIAVRANGRPVSCARGCSACCRIQPVPVTPAEAYGLLQLVEDLPEPKRGRVLSRFADRQARLASAGLADAYLEGQRAGSEEQAKANAKAYLNLRLACPFLEDDDSCGIYKDRPFVCREYWVTSEKELCEDPLALPVETVPMLASLAAASIEAAAEVSGQACYTIPLTLALAFAAKHRAELERTYSGVDILNRSMRSAVSAVHRSTSSSI
jgi:Fe-S-cluster containining protein